MIMGLYDIEGWKDSIIIERVKRVTLDRDGNLVGSINNQLFNYT
jgi:hypothetical protein